MSFVKIWIHVVWTTKNRAPVLVKEKRQELFEHIHNNGLAKKLMIEIVNGHHNHVHCLLRLRNDQTIMKVVQLLKGESAHWANKMKMLPEKLVWQKEYYAVGVSESAVPKVKAYIFNKKNIIRKSLGPRNSQNLLLNIIFR